MLIAALLSCELTSQEVLLLCQLPGPLTTHNMNRSETMIVQESFADLTEDNAIIFIIDQKNTTSRYQDSVLDLFSSLDLESVVSCETLSTEKVNTDQQVSPFTLAVVGCGLLFSLLITVGCCIVCR